MKWGGSHRYTEGQIAHRCRLGGSTSLLIGPLASNRWCRLRLAPLLDIYMYIYICICFHSGAPQRADRYCSYTMMTSIPMPKPCLSSPSFHPSRSQDLIVKSIRRSRFRFCVASEIDIDIGGGGSAAGNKGPSRAKNEETVTSVVNCVASCRTESKSEYGCGASLCSCVEVPYGVFVLCPFQD